MTMPGRAPVKKISLSAIAKCGAIPIPSAGRSSSAVQTLMSSEIDNVRSRALPRGPSEPRSANGSVATKPTRGWRPHLKNDRNAVRS